MKKFISNFIMFNHNFVSMALIPLWINSTQHYTHKFTKNTDEKIEKNLLLTPYVEVHMVQHTHLDVSLHACIYSTKCLTHLHLSCLFEFNCLIAFRPSLQSIHVILLLSLFHLFFFFLYLYLFTNKH
jgi:hypothetical protein